MGGGECLSNTSRLRGYGFTKTYSFTVILNCSCSGASSNKRRALLLIVIDFQNQLNGNLLGRILDNQYANKKWWWQSLID
jgi:hypothetical protein